MENPLEGHSEADVPDFVLKSELQMLWMDGRGKDRLIDNVETLVDRIIEREAELLIDQNKHKASVKKPIENLGFSKPMNQA